MDLIMPIRIEEIPAHEVTATSLDLFNHHERVESTYSMDQTEFLQLMDFHKRMDTQMKQNSKKGP
jgi:hypothetical protein